MDRTERKCALITGAGSGIGAATAVRFAVAGYDVIVNYSRNRDGAEATAERCRDFGVEAIAVRGDIANDADCHAIVLAADERFGRIDALVNNAGITRYAKAGDLDASNATDFADIFSVNVTGTYQIIRAALPLLRQATLGSVVNVSSDSAFSGSGSSLAYAASKGALNTMTVGLARSLAPSVRVNAVCPGFVDTTWALAWQSEQDYGKFRQRLTDMAPLKSIPSADDIADAILWLSDRAGCITGQCIVIDSGAHLVEGSV
jgi:3-oxoacyl-[acyl-carrier protein] reductase